jgi:hypothetical protein
MADPNEIEIKGERPIGNNTDYSDFFNGKRTVFHYLLSIDQKTQGAYPQALIYTAELQSSAPEKASLDELVEYCKGLAINGTERQPLAIESPLDMVVRDDQCWLIIELDQAINWSFARDSRACTSKHGDPDHNAGKKGHNLWLRHVYKTGAVLEKTTKDDAGADGCRVLFFGVAHRGHPRHNTTPHHYFNLKIEFFQEEANRMLFLPVVLDPDVGNDGHDEIPPP